MTTLDDLYKEKPQPEDFGFQSANSPESPSGWMYEGGEEAYYAALAEWESLKKCQR